MVLDRVWETALGEKGLASCELSDVMYLLVSNHVDFIREILPYSKKGWEDKRDKERHLSELKWVSPISFYHTSEIVFGLILP